MQIIISNFSALRENGLSNTKQGSCQVSIFCPLTLDTVLIAKSFIFAVALQTASALRATAASHGKKVFCFQGKRIIL